MYSDHTTNFRSLDRAGAAWRSCCCMRGVRSDDSGRVLRYQTGPHVRGAGLYDGDTLIAVGDILSIESAAERLNSDSSLDRAALLRAWGLSGYTACRRADAGPSF